MKLRCMVAVIAAVALHGIVEAQGRYREPVRLSKVFPNLEEIALPQTVDGIGWLGNYRLRRLDISYSDIESIAGMGKKITVLRARGLRIQAADLGLLPRKLQELDLRETVVYSSDKLLELPLPLGNLSLSRSARERLRFLPGQVKDLRLGEIDIAKAKDWPRGLTSLELLRPAGRTWEPRLPRSLSRLIIQHDGLDEWPEIPEHVQHIGIKRWIDSRRISLEAPELLESLIVEGPVRLKGWENLKRLTALKLRVGPGNMPPKLPETIRTLIIESLGQELGPFQWPPSLQTLQLRNFTVGSAVAVPGDLDGLDLGGSQEIAPVKLPTKLQTLSLEHWRTVDLKNVPRGIKALNLSRVKGLENLDEWPPELEVLVIEGADGRWLRNLPNTLKVLDIDDGTNLSTLSLPGNLRLLSARGSDLRAVPVNLGKLKVLDICGSKIGTIAEIPGTVKMLQVTEGQLSGRLRAPSVTHLELRAKANECRDVEVQLWKFPEAEDARRARVVQTMLEG